MISSTCLRTSALDVAKAIDSSTSLTKQLHVGLSLSCTRGCALVQDEIVLALAFLQRLSKVEKRTPKNGMSPGCDASRIQTSDL